MVFASTHYGFGMHVKDIKASGGNVTEALKVRSLWKPATEHG